MFSLSVVGEKRTWEKICVNLILKWMKMVVSYGLSLVLKMRRERQMKRRQNKEKESLVNLNEERG
ncbi:hypothetical protein HanRHA438_Chr14g0642561 [Helianthus annuus]|nr:hypothetical protein HanRHA438_Chr14g0642561 [Helianthus annuus]